MAAHNVKTHCNIYNKPPNTNTRQRRKFCTAEFHSYSTKKKLDNATLVSVIRSSFLTHFSCSLFLTHLSWPNGKSVCLWSCRLGFDFESVQTNDFKIGIAASLLDVQHQRDRVENKPAGLLVAPLGKALCGISSSWCGRQLAGNS